MSVVFAAGAFAAVGCGMSTAPVDANSAAVQPVAAPAAGIQGTAHGGYFPITSALVQLWMPGVSGYGSTPTLLAATTTSGSTGSFTLPGSYTCPTGATDIPVYITITGGYPTNLATPNSYLALAAAIGPCSNASNMTGIIVNEVTTVATIWSVGQFSSVGQAAGVASGSAGATTINSVTGTTAANGGNIGAPIGTLASGSWAGSPTNGYLTGEAVTITNALDYSNIKNAFNTAFNLANIQSGTAGPGPIPSLSTATCATGSWSGGYCPAATNISNDVIGTFSTTAKINSIAAVLAACVQSIGGSPCTSIAGLDSNSTATSNSGVTPIGLTPATDTVQISLYMALEPYHYGDSSATDAQDNITSVFGYGAPETAFTPVLAYAPFDWTLAITYTGLAVNATPTGTLAGLQSTAVDASGNVWMAANTANMLFGVTATGQPINNGSGYTGFNSADQLSIDASGTIWAGSGNFNTIEWIKPPSATVTSYTAIATPLCGAYDLTFDTKMNMLFVCTKDTTVDSGSLPMNGLVNTGTTVSPTYTGSVPYFSVNAAGSGYSNTGGAVTVTFSGGGCTTEPTAAALTALSGAVPTGTYATATPGSGCATAPTIALGGGGSSATATSTFTSTFGNPAIGTMQGADTIYQIAADSNGNIWVPNYISSTGPITVTKMTPNALPSPTSYTATTYSGYSGTVDVGSYTPGIGVDHGNNVWFVANGSLVLNEQAYNGGSYGSLTHYTGGGMASPGYIAMDGAGDIWIANTSLNAVIGSPQYARFSIVSEFNNTGKAITPAGISGTSSGGYAHNMGTPKFVAIDGSGNVWVPNTAAAQKITAWSVTGSTLTLTTSGAAYASGQYITLYGFTTTTALNGLQILLGSGTGSTSLVGAVYGPGTLPTGSGTENGLAIYGSGIAPDVTEIVGAAVPVYAPLGLAPLNNEIGALP